MLEDCNFIKKRDANIGVFPWIRRNFNIVFTDFLKYFQFDVRWISCNYLHEKNQNETHSGCYFLPVILTEIKFHFWGYVLFRYPKIKLFERKHLPMLLLHQAKIADQKIQTKMNFISFLSQWKLLKTEFFHGETNFPFGSHLNTLSVRAFTMTSSDCRK